MQNKILIVTECFHPEEFKINDVAIQWQKLGYEVDVLTLAPTYPIGRVYDGYRNKLFYREEFKGIRIYRVFAITGYREIFMKKILRFLNFMILGTFAAIFLGRKYNYIFGFNAGALTSMLPAVIASKLYKKPLMFWVQDIWPDSLYAYGLTKNKFTSYFLNHFVRFMHKNISSIAISSKGFEKKLRPFINKEIRFQYLPNWADDLDLNLAAFNFSDKHLTHFTFAGNIGKQQNLENIINAFCLISPKLKKNAQLNIIGDGPSLEKIKEISFDAKNIIFHGKQKREVMAKYYKSSDFLIVSLVDKPAFSITVPSKTQTYIAAKKPILAIINGETANLVSDYNLGLCADPKDVDAISRLFEECILMSDNSRQSYTTHNDELLATVFSKNDTINQLLENLVNSSEAPR